MHYVKLYDTIKKQYEQYYVGGIRMREENLVRDCMHCEEYGIGCEENCIFELPESSISSPSILRKRKAMKAEKFNGVRKATILSHSAEKNKGQRNLYETPKKSYNRAEKNLDKQKQRRAKRVTKNQSSKK